MRGIFLRSIFSTVILLFLISTPNSVKAYVPYTDFFPSIGSVHYLGDVNIGEQPVSVYIADDDTINTMIYWRYYTNENRKWTAKVLMAFKTEKFRQAFVKMLNEGANNDTWAINNQLSLPVNNKVWAIREDVSYYPNDNLINVKGGWAYNDYGEMIGFDKNRLLKTSTFKYGDDEYYSAVCDLVSSFMAERYQEAITNSQNVAR